MKSVEDRLRELPEDAGLKRIEADDMLRRRILKAASEQERKKPERKKQGLFPATILLPGAAEADGWISPPG